MYNLGDTGDTGDIRGDDLDLDPESSRVRRRDDGWRREPTRVGVRVRREVGGTPTTGSGVSLLDLGRDDWPMGTPGTKGGGYPWAGCWGTMKMSCSLGAGGGTPDGGRYVVE